jgi:hypothetical protein
MKNLPVYRAYRNGRTRTVTILRNFRGNMTVPPTPPPPPPPPCDSLTAFLLPFFQDLRMAVQAVVGPDVAVVQRLGRIDILGNHASRVKTWLASLGF